LKYLRCFLGLTLLATLLIAAELLGSSARADPATQAPAESRASTIEIQQLIDILENDTTRQRLIEQLRSAVAEQQAAPTAEPAAPGGFATRSMTAIAESATDMGAHLLGVLSFIGDAPRFLNWLRLEASQPENRQRVLVALWHLALTLGIGWLVEGALWGLGQGWRARLEAAQPATLWRRLRAKLLYWTLGFVPILVFWISATSALAVVQPGETTSLIAVTLINTHAAAQGLALLTRIVFVPQSRALRLLPLPDELATDIDRWIRRTARIAIYGYGISLATLFMGLPQSLVSFVMRLLGLVVAALLIVLVIRLRHAIAMLIRDAAAGSALRLNTPVSRYWHIPVLAYILVALFIWLARPGDAMAFLVRATVITVLLVGFVAAAVATASRILGRWVQRAPWLDRRGYAFRTRAMRYLQAVRVILSIVAIAATALTVIEAWGLDAVEWFDTIGGPRLVSGLASIGIIVVIAIVIWEAISVMIERRLAAADDGTLEGLRRAARLRTLMPLFDRITFLVLAACVILIGLSELGIDIAPLLAGAGVVGIAVGFGAQAVVKDMLAGMSVILEGTMSVGDIVTIGDKGGVVEAMSLRVLRLRDFDGTVHVIPFGEITRISNLTKDYSYAVFRIGVAYNADIEKVQTIIKAVVQRMRADSKYKSMILDEVELHGVDSFGDSAVIVLARVKVAPARQWTITRDFNVLLKAEFDRQGIEIPFPQRTISFAPGTSGDAGTFAAARGGAD
jgi:moderate conductance mechanosensitive channel